MTFDRYVQRVRSLLQVKTLPLIYEPIVLSAWEADWTPEMAAGSWIRRAAGDASTRTPTRSRR